MNFFERQAAARSLSRRLVMLFALAVLGIVVAVDTVVVVALSLQQRSSGYGLYNGELVNGVSSGHSAAIFLTSVIVLAVIGIAAVYKSSVVGSGGAAVAISMGGERVPANTTDPIAKRLLNVVEEISIASGVPVPQVFVLERETGINAFAAGNSPSDAAVAVTRGALDTLDRTELQGVIAHEFSHVLNGDMRLSTRLIGLLYGILVVALAGRLVLRFAPRGRRGGGATAAIIVAALAIMVIGYIGLFFGRLIQAAVSRSREQLADASAVQFTRDPHGLRNALVKIGALEAGSTLSDTDTEEIAHLLFAPGAQRWLSTHPPLVSRIRELDPSFQPREFEKMRQQMAMQSTPAESATRTSTETSHTAHTADTAETSREITKSNAAARLQQLTAAVIPVTNAAMSQLVANPGAAQMAMAQLIRQSLPDAITQAANDVSGATALFVALALNDHAETLDQQLKFVATQLGESVATQVSQWLPQVDSLNAMQRQPALLRLLPTLQQLGRPERFRLLSCLSGLMLREGRMTVEKYALCKLAQINLGESLKAPQLPGTATLNSNAAELGVLFSVLAQAGSDDALSARAAYEAGMQTLLPTSRPDYVSLNNWNATLDRALTKLDRLLPAAKEMLITALVKTIAFDQKLTSDEAELLRAICAAVHCPLPPLLNPATLQNDSL